MEIGALRGWKLLAATLGVILLVAAVGYGFDRLLYREGVPSPEVVLTSDGLTGMVAGALFVEFVLNERRQRKLMRKRLEVIAEMNHHIRNALQVFSYVAQTKEASQETAMMRDSIQRIEWALREVLPGYAPEKYTPGDGSRSTPTAG